MNIGSGFRAPNVDDIGKIFDSEPGAVTVPNPNLKAETAYSLDIGYVLKLNNVGRIDLTAYYTYLDNALVRRNSQLNGQNEIIYLGELSRVQSIQNAAFAQSYGINLQIDGYLSKYLTATAHINIQDGKEEMDDGNISALRHAAPFFGRFSLDYKNAKWSISGITEFQGKRSFEDLAVEERAKTEIYAKDALGRSYVPARYDPSCIAKNKKK